MSSFGYTLAASERRPCSMRKSSVAERQIEIPGDPAVPQSAPAGDGRGTLLRIWRWLRVAIVLGMLAGLVVIAKPGQLWHTIISARYVWIWAVAPALCATFCDGFKLYCLVRPLGFRGGWWSVLQTNLVVNSVSQFLPGTIGGGAVAWWRLSRADNLRAQMFAALGMNTVVKLAVIGGAGGLALALDAQSAGAYRVWTAPLLVVAALPLGLYLLVICTPLPTWLKRSQALMAGRFLPLRVHDAIRKILESVESYRGAWPMALLALAFGVARMLVFVWVPIFCLRAVGAPPVGYVRLLWITCAIEVSGMIPLTLSGWGLPQVTAVALLALSGVTEAQAVSALGVLSPAAQLPVYLAGAGVLLAEAVHRKRPSGDQMALDRDRVSR